MNMFLELKLNYANKMWFFLKSLRFTKIVNKMQQTNYPRNENSLNNWWKNPINIGSKTPKCFEIGMLTHVLSCQQFSSKLLQLWTDLRGLREHRSSWHTFCTACKMGPRRLSNVSYTPIGNHFWIILILLNAYLACRHNLSGCKMHVAVSSANPKLQDWGNKMCYCSFCILYFSTVHSRQTSNTNMANIGNWYNKIQP